LISLLSSCLKSMVRLRHSRCGLILDDYLLVEGLAPYPGEIATWLQTERLLEFQLPNQGIHRCLTVLALDLPQEKAYGVAIIPAAELQRLGDDLARAVERHSSSPGLWTEIRGRVAPILRRIPSELESGKLLRHRRVHQGDVLGQTFLVGRVILAQD